MIHELIRNVGPMSDQHSSATSGLRYRGERKGAMTMTERCDPTMSAAAL